MSLDQNTQAPPGNIISSQPGYQPLYYVQYLQPISQPENYQMLYSVPQPLYQPQPIFVSQPQSQPIFVSQPDTQPVFLVQPQFQPQIQPQFQPILLQESESQQQPELNSSNDNRPISVHLSPEPQLISASPPEPIQPIPVQPARPVQPQKNKKPKFVEPKFFNVISKYPLYSLFISVIFLAHWTVKIVVSLKDFGYQIPIFSAFEAFLSCGWLSSIYDFLAFGVDRSCFCRNFCSIFLIILNTFDCYFMFVLSDYYSFKYNRVVFPILNCLFFVAIFSNWILVCRHRRQKRNTEETTALQGTVPP